MGEGNYTLFIARSWAVAKPHFQIGKTARIWAAWLATRMVLSVHGGQTVGGNVGVYLRGGDAGMTKH